VNASIQRSHRTRSQGRGQRGFSLVELMVAITIGLVLLLGITSLIVRNSVTNAELDNTSRQVENGRYALQLLSEDAEHAGFWGTYSSVGTLSSTPDPCATLPANFGFAATTPPTLPVAVYGYTAAAPDPTCIGNRLAGTEVFVVRRASTTQVAAPTGGLTYLQTSNCATDTAPFALGSAAGSFTLLQKDCATVAPMRQYMVHVYFVSACNVCGTDTTPTLKMAELGNGTMTLTPLVDGIQNLQVDYGIDMDGDGAPDCYVSDPGNPAPAQIAVSVCPQTAPLFDWTNVLNNWANVTAVRLHVLARDTTAIGSWQDTRTYDLGLTGSVGPFNDGYRRHAYSAVARLYNIGGEREVP
jgi:type IV pilus assembly protein PilW